MPLQDLTPELRTRLSRIEKIVGLFVLLAALILLTGFVFYIYDTAQRRGWFVTKINYATALNDATGIKKGDPVKLMGFSVGEITDFSLNAPELKHGIRIFFSVREPYYDYIWYDSRVRVISDLLGNRYLEITKGQNGSPTVFTNKTGTLLVLNQTPTYAKYQALTKELGATNSADEAIFLEVTNQLMDSITNHIDDYYTNALAANYTKPPDINATREKKNYYWIAAIDEPALSDRLSAVANQIEKALPNILAMTNQLAAILSNANNTVARLDGVLAETHPILTNLTVVTRNLRDPNGSLGNWLIPTNLVSQLHETLQSANQTLQAAHTTLDSTDTNVTMLATDLDKTLQHLSDLTSNLAWQVQMNTNLITDISTTIVHTDGLIQGLKRHWLLRSAFKTKPVKKPAEETPSTNFPTRP